MNLVTAAPRPPLDRWVDSLIYYTGYSPEHRIERVIPDGHIYLVFELDGMPRHIFDNSTLEPIAHFEHAWLSGVHRHYLSIEACPDSSMFVVRFRPGGAAPFLPYPVEHYSDRVTAAAEIFGSSVLELRERLYGADAAETAISEAAVWLHAQWRALSGPADRVTEAVDGILRDPSFARTTLEKLISASGYSRKHFIEHFRRQVGITPKLFQRIVRFSEILPRVVERRSVSWTDISQDCGYYDQSHFIREFKAFSGYNPAEFLTGPTSDRINFFPLA